MKVRHICAITIAAWLLSLAVGLSLGQIDHHGLVYIAGFFAGAVITRRIAFTEIPPNIHLLIALGMPLFLSLYAVSGDLMRLGSTVSWAVAALSIIAGARAANLWQTLHQRN